jgi:hypothetical protein
MMSSIISTFCGNQLCGSGTISSDGGLTATVQWGSAVRRGRCRQITDIIVLTLTDFLEGELIEGLTAAAGEAILGPQLGRVCNLPLARRLRRMTPCSGSYGFPPRLTSFFGP